MELDVILQSPIAITLVTYVLLIAGLAVVCQPLRFRMVAIGESILAEGRWNNEQRDDINQLLDTAMSFRVGVLLPVAAVATVVDDVLGRVPVMSKARMELSKDDRFHALLGRYFISVLAANPLFAIVSLPLIALSFLVSALMGKAGREAFEEPVLAAMEAPGGRLAY